MSERLPDSRHFVSRDGKAPPKENREGTKIGGGVRGQPVAFTRVDPRGHSFFFRFELGRSRRMRDLDLQN